MVLIAVTILLAFRLLSRLADWLLFDGFGRA
jgi:hypothetical protein